MRLRLCRLILGVAEPQRLTSRPFCAKPPDNQLHPNEVLKLKHLFTVLGVVGFVFACTCAQAQSLTLTPAVLEAQVQRGATYANSFILMNSTDARLRVHCSLNDYWYDENNRRITGRPGTLPRSASSWIQFSSTELVLEPHSSTSVKFVISVPQDAAGGYYTSPTFETEAVDEPPARGISTSQTKIKIRFQGLLLLTTTDATEYNVEIMGVQISPPTASRSLEVNVDVRNRSTTHTRVGGMFALLDPSGKLAGRGKIKEKRFLPGERNTLKTAWVGGLASGHYRAVVTLNYERAGAEPLTIFYELPFEANALATLSRQ